MSTSQHYPKLLPRSALMSTITSVPVFGIAEGPSLPDDGNVVNGSDDAAKNRVWTL
jgi:hypothetical protein